MTIIKHDFQNKKHAANTTETKKKKIPGMQLRIDLSYSSPLICRTVNVPGTLTLSDLHTIIQICFGWDNEATHRFLVGKIFYNPGKTDTSTGSISDSDVQLHELEKDMGFIFSYLYDGGCGWECEISLEQLIPDSRDIPHPVLIAADGAYPPASIEDIHEYQDMLARLDKAAVGREKILAEYGLASTFEPAYCDMESINDNLVKTFKR